MYVYYAGCKTKYMVLERRTDRHPFNGLFSRTAWISQHQNG